MTARREWDDARLNAAFRARFAAAAPAGMLEGIHERAAGAGQPRKQARFVLQARPLRLAAAPLLVGAVAIAVVVGSLSGAPGPSPSLGSPAATQSAIAGTPKPTSGDATVHPSGPPPPTTISVPGMDGEQPVLTVTQALQRPVNEPPNREIVVGGWYSFIPVPCPNVPDETSALESCAVGFTWLMEDPQSVSAGARPSGAAFNIVTAFTNWQPPTGNQPVAIVVIGHFDDRRADECPAGERQTRCKALFVVDAPLWTGAVGAVEVGNGPDTAAGLPVIDIAAAIDIRDSSSWREIAVAGWYNDPSYFSCPFHGDAGATWLQGYCEDGFRWLMAEPELLTTLDGNGTQLRGPTGKAIQTAFSTVRPVSGNGWPESGSPLPIPAVFVGHFNDHHAADCYGPNTSPTGEMLKGCRDRFVVDQVAWLNGTALEPASSDWRDPETPPTPSDAEVRGILARHFANAAVLDTTLMSGADLLRIAPAFVDYPLLVAAASVRVVTLLDPGMPGTPCPTRVCDMDEIRPHALILVIGPSGDLYFDFGSRAVNFLPDVIVLPADPRFPVGS